MIGGSADSGSEAAGLSVAKAGSTRRGSGEEMARVVGVDALASGERVVCRWVFIGGVVSYMVGLC